MATPNYEQIQSFGNVSAQLRQAAVDEFMEYVHDGMTIDEAIEAATHVATKFSYLGEELGAQWYDLCTELAGIDADAAYLPEVDEGTIRGHARRVAETSTGDTVGQVFNSFLQSEINNSIRRTGSANLWRDYERGLTPGKWARVPVGPTCAWCLMLASQGAWYISEKTALGTDPGHYHDDCNCIAVYHANPEDINGYRRTLEGYKDTYYLADDTRKAHNSGRREYSEELENRVKNAKERHRQREEKRAREAAERGEDYEKVPWTVYNEDLIIMRYQNPGMK